MKNRPLRFRSASWLGVLLSLLAATSIAQSTSGPIDTRDPFEIRAGGEGDRMMGPNHWYNYHYDRSYDYLAYDLHDPYHMVQSVRAGVPPQPPVLAEPLSQAAPIRIAAEELSRLADCAGEPFYMPFVRLYRQHLLSADRLKRIDDYRAARQQLAAEIRARLDELTDAPPTRRATGLAELAAAQAGRLRALETEAEAIRVDLTTLRFFKSYDSNWELSELATGQAKAVDENLREYYAMLEAAEYFDGFSLDQRSLLLEMCFEARARADARKQPPEAQPPSVLFFLPATTRIHLPEKHPAALDEKVRAFLARKNDLKEELRTAVYRNGRSFFPSQRTEQFRRLAEQQAPRFAELDALAENIRGEMAGLPYPDKPDEQSALPPELLQRIGTLAERQAELQRDLARRLRALRTESSGAKFEIVRRGDNLTIRPVGKDVAPSSSLESFNSELSRRYGELVRENDHLRQAVQRYIQTSPSPGGERGVDALTLDFGVAFHAEVNWNRYQDYYRAVLEPGLSSAQRRVLFNAAFSGILETVTPIAP